MRSVILDYLDGKVMVKLFDATNHVVWKSGGDVDQKRVLKAIEGLVDEQAISVIERPIARGVAERYIVPGPRWKDVVGNAAGGWGVDQAVDRVIREHGACRVSRDQMPGPGVVSILLDMVEAGELDLAFVPRTARVVAYQVEKGTTVKIPFYGEVAIDPAMEDDWTMMRESEVE